MIQPNWDYLLWFIIISYGLNAIAMIGQGVMKTEKDTHYGSRDVIGGIVRFIILAILLAL